MEVQNSAPSSRCNKDLSKKLVGSLGSLHPPPHWLVLQGSSSSMKRLVEDSDRLTALPEDIQKEIMSFLPTTDAAKIGFTSAACWTAWKSLQKLIFDLDQFPRTYRGFGNQRNSFIGFVNHALKCHSKSDVHTFELLLWPSIEYRCLIYIKWIKFAVKHNVQKLVLFGRMARNRKVPECVFLSKSIVNLELAIEGQLFTWSKDWTLPNLRELKLKFLVFCQASSRDMFSCCSALKKLSIMFCDMTAFKDFHVSSPTLAEIMMCYCLGMGNISFSVQSHLSKFIWMSYKGSEIKLVPAQFELVSAGRTMMLENESSTDSTSLVINVTRELFKAKHLLVISGLIEILSMAHDLPRQLEVDAFCNLKYLTIGLYSDMANVKTAVLLISRCLFVSQVRLELEGSSNEFVDYTELDEYLRISGCGRRFSELTYIRVLNFQGTSMDLNLVRLLLGHAHHLERMRIDFNMFMVNNDFYGLLGKMSIIVNYDRASPAARVRFHH